MTVAGLDRPLIDANALAGGNRRRLNTERTSEEGAAGTLDEKMTRDVTNQAGFRFASHYVF